MSITTVLGSETIAVSGSVTVTSGEPFLDGGVLVILTEIAAAELTGESVTGQVTVSESPALASLGEIRALQPGPQFPASSSFDAYLEIEVPASPSPTKTIHNVDPLVIDAASPLGAWPPLGVKYAATPVPCLPLLPSDPLQACIDDVTITFDGYVGGVAEASAIVAAPLASEGSSGGRAWIAYAALVAAAVAAIGGGWLAVRRRTQ